MTEPQPKNMVLKLDRDLLDPALFKELKRYDKNNDGTVDGAMLVSLLRAARETRIEKKRAVCTLIVTGFTTLILVMSVFGMCYWAIKLGQNVSTQPGATTSLPPSSSPSPLTPASYSNPSTLTSNPVQGNGAPLNVASNIIHPETGPTAVGQSVSSSSASYRPADTDITHLYNTFDSAKKAHVDMGDDIHFLHPKSHGSPELLFLTQAKYRRPADRMRTLSNFPITPGAVPVYTIDATEAQIFKSASTIGTSIDFAGTFGSNTSIQALTVVQTSYSTFLNGDWGFKAYAAYRGQQITFEVDCPNGASTCSVLDNQPTVTGLAHNYVSHKNKKDVLSLFSEIDSCHESDPCFSLSNDDCEQNSSCMRKGQICLSRCSSITNPSLCGCHAHCSLESSSSSSSSASSSSSSSVCVDNACHLVHEAHGCLPVSLRDYKCSCDELAANETKCAVNCQTPSSSEAELKLADDNVMSVSSMYASSSLSLSDSTSTPSPTTTTAPTTTSAPVTYTYCGLTTSYDWTSKFAVLPSCACFSMMTKNVTCPSGSQQPCWSCANIPVVPCTTALCSWQLKNGPLKFCSAWTLNDPTSTINFSNGTCGVGCFPPNAKVNILREPEKVLQNKRDKSTMISLFSTLFDGEPNINNALINADTDVVSIPFSELRVGDFVESVTSSSATEWTRVLHLPHERNYKLTEFIEIEYVMKQNNAPVKGVFSITGNHLIYVKKSTTDLSSPFSSLPIVAGSLSVGDEIWHRHQDQTVLVTISDLKITHSFGAYTAYTANTRIVVDGIVASGFSASGVSSIDYSVYRLAKSLLSSTADDRLAERVTTLFVDHVTHNPIVKFMQNAYVTLLSTINTRS